MQEGDHMVLLLCRHNLHLNCASGWLQHHATCPICRADLVRLAADFKHQHHQHLRHAQHQLQAHDQQQQQQHQMTSLHNLQDVVVADEGNVDGGSDKPHNASVREKGTIRRAAPTEFEDSSVSRTDCTHSTVSKVHAVAS